MKYKRLILLLLLLLVVLVPTAFAEGQGNVVQIDENTLFMDYDQEIRYLNQTITPTFDTIPFNFYETDTRFSSTFQVQNRNFNRLCVYNAPEVSNQERYDLLYCTANEIPQYRNNQIERETRCPSNWYTYEFVDYFRNNQCRNLRIPDLINGTNAFWWFIGGDSQGNNAAGGGGGLPVCGGLSPNFLQNQTVTPYGGQFKLSGIIGYIGYTAGCTGVSIRYDINRTDTGSLTLLPSASQTYTALNCSGDNCVISPASLGVWYHRYPSCDKSEGYAVNIRGTFKGYYNSRLYTYYRYLTHTCEAIPEQPQEEEEETILPINPPSKKKEVNLLFLALLPLMAIMTIKKREKNKSN